MEIDNARRFKLKIILGIVIIDLLFMSMAVVFLIHSRVHYQGSIDLMCHNLVQLMEQRLSDKVRLIDDAVVRVEREIERQMAYGGIDDRALKQILDSEQAQLPEINAIRVTNAAGDVCWGKDIVPGTIISYADREFFRNIRDDSIRDLLVTEPVKDEVSGSWVIGFTHRYLTNEGKFAGIISAAVPVETFSKLLSSLNFGKTDTVVLRYADMGLITRTPPINGPAGQPGNKTVSDEFKKQIESGLSVATFHTTGTPDRVERTYALRRVGHLPFTVAVGLVDEVYLSSWWREVLCISISLLVFFLITSIFAWLAVRHIRLRTDMENTIIESMTIHRILIEQSRDGIVILDHTGKVREANHRFAEMLKYTPEEILHLHVWDWDTRWTHEQLLEMIGQIGATGDHFETHHRRKDGTVFDVEISTNGAVIGEQKLVFCVCRDITERKQAEALLKENEEKYRIVFENMVQGAFYQRNDGTLIDCNPAILELFGLTRDQFLGRTSMDPNWQVIYEDGSDFPCEKHPSMEALRTGKPVYGVTAGVFNPRKDDYVWLIINANPLFRNGDDHPFKVFVTLHDITELKRNEKALREAHWRLESIIEATRAGTWEWNIQTGQMVVNRTWAQIVGYTCDELTPISIKTWEVIVHPDDMKQTRNLLDQHFAGDIPYYNCEYRRKHKDGHWVWVLDRGRVITRTDDGKPLMMFGTVTDITERKWSEEMLRKNEDRFNQLADQSRTVTWEIDDKGLYIHVSHVAKSVFGYGPDEIVGRKHFYDLHPESGRDEFMKSAFAVFDRKEPFIDYENVMQTKDGREVWVATNGIPILDSNGALKGYRGSDTDITHRKLAEDKLKEYEKVVEGLEEMIAVVDRDYRYLIANRALLNFLNRERDQVVGRLVSEIVGKEKFETTVKKKMDRCFQGNVVKYEINYEYPIVGERDLFITYLPIEGQSDVDRLASVVQDITERKAAQKELERHREHLEDIVNERTSELENANRELDHENKERKRIEIQLRESEEKFRTLVEQIPAITYIISIDGNRFLTQYVSPQVESMLGFTSEESIADRTLKSRIHPDDRERVLSQIRKIKRAIGPFSSEYRVIARNGNLKWFRDESRVIRDSFGSPIFLQGVMIDISDIKKMEEALRYSEKLYRTVFETTGTAMILIEEDTTISLANAQYEKYVGFSKHEIEGKKSWTNIIVTDDLDRLKTYHTLRRNLPDLPPKQYETQIVDTRGKKRHVLVTIEMIPGTRKSVASLLDITDRKQTERNLDQSVAELNNLQHITRKLLQQEDLSVVLFSIAEGIVEKIGYDMALAVRYMEKEKMLTNLVIYPSHLESGMHQYFEENSKMTIGEQKIKCVDEPNSIFNRILNGETVIGASLVPFISQWVSSVNAQQIQVQTNRAGYIALPMQVKGETVGMILAGWNSKEKDLVKMHTALGRVADQAAVAVKSAGLFEDVLQKRKELRSLTAKLQKVQEYERKKIALELHDRVGQNLTGLSINLGIIKSLLHPECAACILSRIADCTGLVSSTMNCIRDVMAELHPPGLTEYGLSVAIRCYCDQLSRRTGLKVSMDPVEDTFPLDQDCDMALFRIAQEALTNTIKHSNATEVTVSLKSIGKKLVLCIADNGEGFDREDQLSIGDGGMFGLISMKERADAVGGEFRVETAPGKGTKVIVELDQVI